MPVGRMLDEMTSSELAEWQAFDRIEPFGEQRADLRSAIVAATVASSGTNRPKRAPKVADFLPFADKPAPVLLADPAAQGRLIAETVFAGVKVVDTRRLH